MTISLYTLLRMRKVLDKSYRENHNAHFMFSNFFRSCTVYEIMENVVETEWATNDVTLWRIRVACWIRKATCTYAHAHAHAPGHTHPCASAHLDTNARARAHTHSYIIHIIFRGNNDSRTRLNVS